MHGKFIINLALNYLLSAVKKTTYNCADWLRQSALAYHIDRMIFLPIIVLLQRGNRLKIRRGTLYNKGYCESHERTYVVKD